MKQTRKQFSWKPIYTWVLIANLVYIILFFFLTNLFKN